MDKDAPLVRCVNRGSSFVKLASPKKTSSEHGVIFQLNLILEVTSNMLGKTLNLQMIYIVVLHRKLQYRNIHSSKFFGKFKKDNFYVVG